MKTPRIDQSTHMARERDLVLAGTVIPAGAQVLVSLGAAGRDPPRYPEPDSFDTTREDTSHLAFGHRIHQCVGARLARLEAKLSAGRSSPIVTG